MILPQKKIIIDNDFTIKNKLYTYMIDCKV